MAAVLEGREAESRKHTIIKAQRKNCCVVKVKEEKLGDERGVKKRKDAIGGGEGV